MGSIIADFIRIRVTGQRFCTLMFFNFAIWYDHCRCHCHCHWQASIRKEIPSQSPDHCHSVSPRIDHKGRGRLAQSHACCAFGPVLLLLPHALLLLLLFSLFCCFQGLRLPLHLANLCTDFPRLPRREIKTTRPYSYQVNIAQEKDLKMIPRRHQLITWIHSRRQTPKVLHMTQLNAFVPGPPPF